jgi:hypothetical protein
MGGSQSLDIGQARVGGEARDSDLRLKGSVVKGAARFPKLRCKSPLVWLAWEASMQLSLDSI